MAIERARPLAAAVLACLLAPAAWAQNLISNPDFGSSLTGWTFAGQPGQGTFVYQSSGGDPTGGRAYGRVSTSAQFADVTLSQCVAVREGRVYDMHGRVMTPPSAGGGTVGVQVRWFDLPGCTGGELALDTVSSQAPLGVWSSLGYLRAAPSGVHSAKFILWVYKTMGTQFDGAFDNLYFGPPKGDLTGDGRNDLLLRATDPLGAPAQRVWRMLDGQRLSDTAVLPDLASHDWRVAGVDDFFDYDGDGDFVLRNLVTGEMEFWAMQAGLQDYALPLSGAAPPPSNWTLAATADFDRDGAPDLLWRNETSQKLVVWRMALNARVGALAINPDVAPGPSWRLGAAQDMNADGNVDLVWHDTASGAVSVWYMTAGLSRILALPTNPGVVSPGWSLAAGGDWGAGSGGPAGSNDLVWREDATGRLYVWYMDNAGKLVSAAFTSPQGPGAGWAVAGPR